MSRIPPIPPVRSTSAAVPMGTKGASSSIIQGQHNWRGTSAESQQPSTAPRNSSLLTSVMRVNSVYPMHMRLRSLSAAKEADRLRGQEALRMLHKEATQSDSTSGDQTGKTENRRNRSGDNVSDHNQVQKKKKRELFFKKNTIQNNEMTTNVKFADSETEYTTERHRKTFRFSKEGRQKREDNQQRSLNPKIIVSNGTSQREFDLGKFAIYRNDIILKLRSVGLRPGRKKDKNNQRCGGGDDSGEYDNMETGPDESVYACYAGGETEI